MVFSWFFSVLFSVPTHFPVNSASRKVCWNLFKNLFKAIEDYDIDEFGNYNKILKSDLLPFGFAGGLKDHDIGLIRFGVRDYDSSIGRWMSKDPILFTGGDPNLYGYVMQDSINYIDPNGMTAEDVQKAIEFVTQKTGMSGASFNFGTPAGITGIALPPLGHILVSSEYAGKLNYYQQKRLLRTIFHELKHLDDGFFKSFFGSKDQHDKIRMDAQNFSDRHWKFAKRRACGGQR